LLFACLSVPGLFRAASVQDTQTAAQAPGVEFDAIDGTDVHEFAEHGLPFSPIILEWGVVIVVATIGRWTAESPAETTVDYSHGGWWCVEHGVPDRGCALCDKSLVAMFKEEGDWCDEHNRPESQCFLYSPARFDKFAALEAKTGHKPPQPTE